MQIGIFDAGINESAVKSIKNELDNAGIRSFTISSRSSPKTADCIIVLGGDRGVRNYFHGNDGSNIPVLGIGESESSGFLAQIDLKEFSSYLNRLKNQNYKIEEVPRIGVKIDGKNAYPVLNDVAVFTSKSATLMEYTLRVNGEEVWHDSSDGVIISTPIGSSAYSMSAGGPVIFSNESLIEVDDISSRLYCEAILDGIDRYKVNKTLECKKFNPAKIIRMKKDSTAISALAKKVHLAEDLLHMPPSSKLLLKILEYEGAMTQKELLTKTMLPDRTIRLALSHLLGKGYVKKKVSIRDARQKIYEISKLD